MTSENVTEAKTVEPSQPQPPQVAVSGWSTSWCHVRGVFEMSINAAQVLIDISSTA
ncbi:hypothetical protein OG625_01125 [Streptomyces sp. NBC_01351]|uniref:hypothetical protein n=1 Tax=Streptomyces sp. NBC_01351 TaxID=2903833 RepID=UPI002E35A7C4|nr:hypothetical protein [Streptomyces sp. NBC_01351]